MKTQCARDNFACIFDQLVSDPMVILQRLDLITLVAMWCCIALFGAWVITRKH